MSKFSIKKTPGVEYGILSPKHINTTPYHNIHRILYIPKYFEEGKK